MTRAEIASVAKRLVKAKIETTRIGGLVKRSPLWEWLRPRRFQVYCVGAPKTGTTSIARLFSRDYRAEHEPGASALVDAISAVADGAMSADELGRFLRRRDRDFRWELESSHLIAAFAGELVELFPAAKFILTVRDVRSWLDSLINHQINVRARPNYPRYWRALSDLYHLRPGQRFQPTERELAAAGLYPLDGYLSFWREHHERILRAVPEHRLLLVRTADITARAADIARFVGAPPTTLDTAASHANVAPVKHGVVARIDQAFLEARIRHHCQPIWSRCCAQLA